MKLTESILINRYAQVLFHYTQFQKKEEWPGLDQETWSPFPKSALKTPHNCGNVAEILSLSGDRKQKSG